MEQPTCPHCMGMATHIICHVPSHYTLPSHEARTVMLLEKILFRLGGGKD